MGISARLVRRVRCAVGHSGPVGPGVEQQLVTLALYVYMDYLCAECVAWFIRRPPTASIVAQMTSLAASVAFTRSLAARHGVALFHLSRHRRRGVCHRDLSTVSRGHDTIYLLLAAPAVQSLTSSSVIACPRGPWGFEMSTVSELSLPLLRRLATPHLQGRLGWGRRGGIYH